MALLNWLTDEETEAIMKLAKDFPEAKSLGDQLNYGIFKLHKKGYKFVGIKVHGKVWDKLHIEKVNMTGFGPYRKKLLDEVLGIEVKNARDKGLRFVNEA